MKVFATPDGTEEVDMCTFKRGDALWIDLENGKGRQEHVSIGRGNCVPARHTTITRALLGDLMKGSPATRA